MTPPSELDGPDVLVDNAGGAAGVRWAVDLPADGPTGWGFARDGRPPVGGRRSRPFA